MLFPAAGCAGVVADCTGVGNEEDPPPPHPETTIVKSKIIRNFMENPSNPFKNVS